MVIWSAEIKELEVLYKTLSGRLPDLEKELQKLIKTDDENIVLIYSRRCLEVIITDLCEKELNRPRKTEPLKGIIDKLNKEEKVPANIIASMLNLNSLSAFGAHPKEFDPRQVKPVLNNLSTIIEWYLKYKDTKTTDTAKHEEAINETKAPDDSTETTSKPTKRLIYIISGLVLVVVIVVAALFIFDIIKDSEISIAVLPLRNVSGNSDLDYMCEGLTIAIINHLGTIESFDKVISSHTMLTYKGTSKRIPEIADELKVKYILDGNYDKNMDQVMVPVSLIETKSDRIIWQHDYDQPYEEIIDIQAYIPITIADELKTELSQEEKEQIEKRPTDNHEALYLYWRGRQFQNTRTKEGFEKAINYYQEAIHLDTNYAMAYSGLAHSYLLQGMYNYLPDNEVLPKVRVVVARALEINNKHGEAHFILGLARAIEFDLVGSEEKYRLAISLNPNHAETYHQYSYTLAALGRSNEAIRAAKTAQELEPVNPVMMRGLGIVYYYANDYDLAIKEFNKCLEIDSGQLATYTHLFLAYLQKEMYDDAIALFEKYITEYDAEKLAALIRKIPKESDYNNTIRQLLDFTADSVAFGTSYFMAMLCVSIGEEDKAFEWLEKSYEKQEFWLRFLRVNPMYDNLRSDPRVDEIIEKIGF